MERHALPKVSLAFSLLLLSACQSQTTQAERFAPVMAAKDETHAAAPFIPVAVTELADLTDYLDYQQNPLFTAQSETAAGSEAEGFAQHLTAYNDYENTLASFEIYGEGRHLPVSHILAYYDNMELALSYAPALTERVTPEQEAQRAHAAAAEAEGEYEDGGSTLEASAATQETPISATGEEAEFAELLGSDAALDNEDLGRVRGAFSPNQANLNLLEAIAANNSNSNSVTGTNIIDSGFENTSGLVSVIQNSGNNTVIQNATIVNLNMVQ